MDKDSLIFVAGHRGLVGSAIVRRLEQEGYTRVITRTRTELDLTNQAAVDAFFAAERPEYVFLAAARVGGIVANSEYAAEFIRDNLLIQTLAIDAAWRNDVKKLCFLGSTCIYPKNCPQPMKEEHLLSSAMEPTNQWYAIAKIAGIKTAQGYRKQYGFNAISLMPTNLYGPGDNYNLETAHALPALLRKVHEAKRDGKDEVVVWGTGAPMREWLHVDDTADAAEYLMRTYDSGEIVNIGWGKDISIKDLALLIKDVVGFEGELTFDTNRPDGHPRKLSDIGYLRSLGWEPKIGLRQGIEHTYRWYQEHEETVRA